MKLPSPSPLTLEDRLAADVFQKSYREFLSLKPTHFRWYELAPQSVAYLKEAQARHWSVEKIADYLQCETVEAAACQKRFIMSEKVNAQETTAARIRQGFVQWLGGVVELDEKAKQTLAGELALLVANQLYAAALSKEDLLQLSLELEGRETEKPSLTPPNPEAPAAWGPQWKD